MCSCLTHLGVQRGVSVVSILQLISHQLLGAAKCWIRTADLLEGCLDGVENLLTRDGDKAQVRFVTNDVLAELQTRTDLQVSWEQSHANQSQTQSPEK